MVSVHVYVYESFIPLLLRSKLLLFSTLQQVSMGSCDDDRSQAPSIPEGDAAIVAPDEEEGTVDPREEQRDLWAQTEGYTPLSDVQYTSLMVSMGPSDGEDSSGDEHSLGWRESGGAFFVNPSAFSTNGNDENDTDGVQDGVARIQNARDLQSSSIDDYESIARTALSLLDEEYERTINVERINPDTPMIFPCSNKDANDYDALSKITPQVQIRDMQNIGAISHDQNKISGRDGFVADWNRLQKDTKLATTLHSEASTAKDMINVDTEAVRKIVHALSLNASNPFQRKFNEWEQRHPSLPSTHSLIPLTPYAAFRRTTDKAKQATASLSRSATLAEALCRLREKGMLTLDAPTLIIDVVGVDHMECESIERIQATFRPIVRWIGVWKGCSYQHALFRLIGRDLAVSIKSRVDLLTPKAATILESAYATCHTGVYHEWLTDSQEGVGMMSPPHIVVAYNSGIWGYNEWQPTIQYLSERLEAAVPFVSTAYTLEECQEDFDVIEATVKSKGQSEVLWEAQANPFGSKMTRDTKSRSSEYRENAAWQAWLLGGKAIDDDV